ncbi:MAG: ATP-binding protein, partial [Gammaproteobacteria bacterium]|nr:ATP-binding protein [Gammaproteobacteria bacterium]
MIISDYDADYHNLPSPIPRYLNVRDILDRRSCLLFGPRQTGKSTLIRQQLDGLPVYNLLDQGLFLRLSRNPTLIREALTPASSAIVIDEIQRMPELLNEVHLMIEEHGIRFFLTGSSTRSLRRLGVNLLGGRIRSRRLHPFVRTELGTRFELRRALEYGLLPPIYFSDAPEEDLAAYAGDYLKEEVAAEALVRNVGAFSRFLEVAALAHGEMINFTNMASDAQVPVSTVREYY